MPILGLNRRYLTRLSEHGERVPACGCGQFLRLYRWKGKASPLINSTEVKCMGNLDIHIGEMLARNARMYPDEVALIEKIPAEGKRFEITWKEFDEQANRFANGLRTKGISKGDKVMHLMNNSIEWLVAYFGIVRTGAWVVPLNFRFASADIKFCAEVAEPQILVFGQEFTERIDPIKKELSSVKYFICCGSEVPSYARSFARVIDESLANPTGVELGFGDPCGLYFTSGTTGQPAHTQEYGQRSNDGKNAPLPDEGR